MNKIRIVLIIFFGLVATQLFSKNSYYDIEYAQAEFNRILYKFMQSPTDIESNKDIFSKLDYLKTRVEDIEVKQTEKFKIDNLIKDIDLVRDFIAPIADEFHSMYKEKEISRLFQIFGNNITSTKLNVKCPIDEIEVIEIRLGPLKICYLHNISKTCKKGFIVKCYAASGNSSFNGQMGVLRNGYTCILNNVTSNYPKMISVKIIDKD